MKKEDIVTLIQLLNSMKEAINKLDSAYKGNKVVQLAEAKKEILSLKEEVDKLL